MRMHNEPPTTVVRCGCGGCDHDRHCDREQAIEVSERPGVLVVVDVDDDTREFLTSLGWELVERSPPRSGYCWLCPFCARR